MSTKISNERYSLNIEMATAMVEDYQSVLKKFWQTVWLEGEAVPHQHCLQWKLGAAAISHWYPFHRGGRGWGVRGWFIHHISWSHWRSWEATQWKGNGEGWDQDREPVSECCPGWQTSAALHSSWGLCIGIGRLAWCLFYWKWRTEGRVQTTRSSHLWVLERRIRAMVAPLRNNTVFIPVKVQWTSSTPCLELSIGGGDKL